MLGSRTPAPRLLGIAALLTLAACSGPSAVPPTEGPEATSASLSPTSATAEPTPPAIPTAVPLSSLRFSTGGWRTNFSKAGVPLSEIESGGPPRDGIPPIDQPKLVAPAEAGDWLQDQEPVVAFEVNGDARAYPLQILIWHEIVDDVVGGAPVVITFCPLCNTAIAFDRRVEQSASIASTFECHNQRARSHCA